MLCNNGTDGHVSCTFTYATKLTIFMQEFNLCNGQLPEENCGNTIQIIFVYCSV